MGNTEGKFIRGLASEEIVEAFRDYILKQEWLRRLLQHKNTFFAIRNNYINIYGYGGSLIKLKYNAGKIRGETHFKYLLRKKIESGKNGKFYISIEDGRPNYDPYDLKNMFEDDFLKGDTLLDQAKLYAGEEKIGVHELMMANPNVLDTEIVFGKDTGEDEDVTGANTFEVEKGNVNDRVDFCALHEGKNGDLKIVFYEAKTFSNKELTNGKVVEQLDRYRKQLKKRETEILKSYRLVCRNIVDLFKETGEIAVPFLEFAKRVNASPNLAIDPDPRLVIFNFNQDQKNRFLPEIKKYLEGKDDKFKGNILSRGNPGEVWKEIKFG